MRIRIYHVAIGFALFLSWVGSLRAQVTAVIPFQGELANQNGVAISPVRPISAIFRLYASPVGGKPLWEEVQTNVVIIAGHFNVLLGSHTPFPDLKIFNGTVYLGITLDDGDATTVDVEMRPRQAIVPVMMAITSHNAEKLNGHDWSDLLVEASGDPSSAKIRMDKVELKLNVTQLRLAKDGLSIAAKGIGTEELGDSSVTTEKIHDQSITASKLAKDVGIPAGTVVAYAGDQLPPGWLWCNGDSYPREGAYSNLFLAIDTWYGSGDGYTTFQVPDYRGRFLRGIDRAGANGPSNVDIDRVQAKMGLGSSQDDAFKSHYHEAHRSKVSEVAPKPEWEHYDMLQDIRVPEDHTWDSRSGGRTRTAETGGIETRPKNVAVNWIIKY